MVSHKADKEIAECLNFYFKKFLRAYGRRMLGGKNHCGKDIMFLLLSAVLKGLYPQREDKHMIKLSNFQREP